jgi:mono/diheme cytochrome c family protein
MRCCSRLLLLLFFAGSPTELALAGANRATDDRETLFETRIRPVLVAQCARCHGAEKINNGLRVDARQSLIHGGDSGAAIVPGHPEQSLLLQAIRQAGDLKMPPPPARRLPDSIIADFEEWIQDGATWPKNDYRSSAWRRRLIGRFGPSSK